MADHLLRFVTDTSVVQSPWAIVDEKIVVEAEGGDPEADKVEERPESAEEESSQGP